jgi:hypothetical protein
MIQNLFMRASLPAGLWPLIESVRTFLCHRANLSWEKMNAHLDNREADGAGMVLDKVED